MADYGRLIAACEESLQRLQMEYVDLLLLHRPTTLEEHEKCFDALMQLQEQGKIKHF
jgi:predicted oxidoreductase